MKKISLISIYIICNAIYAQNYNYLSASISEPRVGKWGQGRISKTEIEVTPKGLFAEISLILTCEPASNKNNYYKFLDSDTVEFSLYFGLPKEATIIDSWLWIDDSYISQALHLERGVASQTYEGIVKRRKDPSILYKNSNGDYELRIYPMKYNSSRKVKISYLMPLKYNNNKLTFSLPSSFVTENNNNYYYYSNQIDTLNPKNITTKVISNTTNGLRYCVQSISGTTITNSEMRVVAPNENIIINRQKWGTNLLFEFDSPFQNGVFYSQYQVGNEVFYQFGLVPNLLADFPSTMSGTKNLLDFDINTDVAKSIINYRQKFPENFLNFKSNTMYSEYGVFKSKSSGFKAIAKFTDNDNIIESVHSFIGNNTNIVSDSMLRKNWAGLRISDLENDYSIYNYYYYNSDIWSDSSYIKNRNQVLFLSLKNRVLATNTSFLALEPGMQSPDCIPCSTSHTSQTYSNATFNLEKSNFSSYNDQNKLFFPQNFSAITQSDSQKNISNDFEIYPNPIIDELNINISENITIYKIQLVDMVGKVAFELDKPTTEINETIKLNLSEILNGIYFLKIYHQGGIYIKKIVIKK